MYTYKRAVGISRLNPKGEEILDISAIPTAQLFTQYDRLVIVVNDAYALMDVAINLDDYRGELLQFSGVIQQWLDTMADVPLRTSNVLPGTEYRYVTVQDIQYRWFSLLPGDVTLGDGRQDLLTIHGANDIRVTRTDNAVVDYEALVDRSLWTINGHLVRAHKGNNCLYLRSAGKHFRVEDNIHVTCLNFNTVSKLKTYPFLPEDIRFEENDVHVFLHFKSPVSLKGKKVWAALGGRLYMDDVIQAKGEYGVTIRVEKVDWFSRIFGSKDLIDLTSIIGKDRQVVPEDFFRKEAFFRALLLDLSSFIIVLDNPHVYVETKPLVTYQYPFTFNTAETRSIPLMTGSGLLPKYHTRRIGHRRLLDIDIGVQKIFLNETTGSLNGGNLYHGFTNRFNPAELPLGYQLYIRGLNQED